MKKSLLSLVIASLLITSCSDDTSNDVKKSVDKTVESVEKSTNDVVDTVKKEVKQVVSEDPAERAEEVFTELNEATQTYYSKIFSMQPMVKSFTYEQISYEKGETSSSAVTKAILLLRNKIGGKNQHEVTFNHRIEHGETLQDQNIALKVISTVAHPEKIDAEFKPFFENFSYETIVKRDDELTQTMTLKPTTLISKDNELDKLNLKGFVIKTQSTLDKLKNGFGDFSGKFEPVEVWEDGEVLGTLNAFDFTGAYKDNHKYHASTSPISFESSEVNFKIESVASKGTYKIHEKLGFATGEHVGSIKNIEINDKDMPAPIVLNSIDFTNNTDLNKNETVSSKGTLKVTPAGDGFKSLTQGKLTLKEINLGFDMDNVPVDALTKYQQLAFDSIDVENESEASETKIEKDKIESQEKKAAMQAQAKAIFEQVKAQGSNMAMNLNVIAEEGIIDFDMQADIIKDSDVSFEQLKKMKDPMIALRLIDLRANARVPAPLLETIAGPNIMMVGMFMTKEGDIYKSKVTTENGKLMINGVPAPF